MNTAFPFERPELIRARWPERYSIVGLFFLSTALCYIDRVSISVAIIPLASQFHLNAAAQGVVLSAFFWGYLWPQLLGGWMADRFGGYRVLATGVAIWSLATFLTPIAAAFSFAALLAVRVLLGLGEGVNFPSIHSLAARWTLPTERTRVIALNFSGMYVGTIVALAATPAIVTHFGWPAIFYISGAAGLFWVTAWLVRSADAPENSPHVSAGELALIATNRAAQPLAPAVPWKRIMGESAVWAIVIAHFCSNFGFNILLLWLPTYLRHTFAMSLRDVGAYSLIPWIATFVAVNAGGWLSDFLITRGMPTTFVRKTMQGLAFSVGGLPLLAIPATHTPGAAVALITLSASANGLSQSAYGVNHLDVGPSHAGILMGLSNTIATIPGIIGVAAAGLIVSITHSFAGVFYMIAAVYAVGLLGYLTWGSGERRL
jgi:MFS transporter, ACS family, solute carrier family 17 (sodium-dependent inorganic phosphate cotransporter), other